MSSKKSWLHSTVEWFSETLWGSSSSASSSKRPKDDLSNSEDERVKKRVKREDEAVEEGGEKGSWAWATFEAATATGGKDDGAASAKEVESNQSSAQSKDFPAEISQGKPSTQQQDSTTRPGNKGLEGTPKKGGETEDLDKKPAAVAKEMSQSPATTPTRKQKLPSTRLPQGIKLPAKQPQQSSRIILDQRALVTKKKNPPSQPQVVNKRVVAPDPSVDPPVASSDKSQPAVASNNLVAPNGVTSSSSTLHPTAAAASNNLEATSDEGVTPITDSQQTAAAALHAKRLNDAAATSAALLPAVPCFYEQFKEDTVVSQGVFIFSLACQWAPVTAPVKVTTAFASGQYSTKMVTPRGCAFSAPGQLPKHVRFGVVSGYHPIFPRVSNDLYAIGLVLQNDTQAVTVDFLKIGSLSTLQHETRAALVQQLPGLISTARIAELWTQACGSLDTRVSILPAHERALEEASFLQHGPVVFSGNQGWSYASLAQKTCWVLTSYLPQGQNRYMLVLGHPFSQSPHEYAIGVVVRFGPHLSLVEFKKTGYMTLLRQSTLWGLSGSAQPTSPEEYRYLRQDLWNHAVTPSNT